MCYNYGELLRTTFKKYILKGQSIIMAVVISNYVKPPSNEWKIENGNWYYGKNGVIARNQWVSDNGNWYRFDNDGRMQVGWVNENDKWYHLSKSGAMDRGWLYDNNRWYFLQNNGVMASNAWIDGMYFVGADGAMYVNRITPDGYKVDYNGRWVIDNISSNGSSNTSNIKASGNRITAPTDYVKLLLDEKTNTVTDYRYVTRNGLGRAGRVKSNDSTPKNLYVHATNIDVTFSDAKELNNGNYELKNRYIKKLKEYNKANRIADSSGHVNRYSLGDGKYAHASFDNDDMPVFDTVTAFYGSLYIRDDCEVSYYSYDKGAFVTTDYSYFVDHDSEYFTQKQMENAVITQLDDAGYITGIFIDVDR